MRARPAHCSWQRSFKRASTEIPLPTTMIASIMQPYLFPYLGYFQLMAASDVFVVHDDVQFIKGGWINRNRILVSGRCQWMTLPVADAPYTREIRQREYQVGQEHRDKLLRRLEGAYRNATNFAATMALIESILAFPERNVAAMNTHALREVASAIGIRTQLLVSSSLDKDCALRGADRVADICARLGATVYLNPIGGTGLYDSAFFDQKGLQLRFIECQPVPYAQGVEPFVPFLSIVDVLMHNKFAAIGGMLSQCRMLQGAEAGARLYYALPSG